MQRPPTSSAASSSTKRLLKAASRRAAAMPAAPAPTITASTQPERGISGVCAGRGAASAELAAALAAEARNKRRLKGFMAYGGFEVSEVYHGRRTMRAAKLVLSPRHLPHRRLLSESRSDRLRLRSGRPSPAWLGRGGPEDTDARRRCQGTLS